MSSIEIATFAGGCFWCTEAIFTRLKGVKSALPGYAGGTIENPTYEQVSSGNTGHAEAIQIEFDPSQISYEKLLDIFWHTHNPTTLNRQGNDVGTQYRSVIFYHDDVQKKAAQQSKAELKASGEFSDSIVTEIVPFTQFYVAEDYHHQYYEHHRNALYCDLVISPKIEKLKMQFSESLK